LLIGTTEESTDSGATFAVTTKSTISGRFSLASAKTLEIQHRSSKTNSAKGFGHAFNFGVIEIYTDVKIWKVS